MASLVVRSIGGASLAAVRIASVCLTASSAFGEVSFTAGLTSFGAVRHEVTTGSGMDHSTTRGRRKATLVRCPMVGSGSREVEDLRYPCARRQPPVGPA